MNSIASGGCATQVANFEGRNVAHPSLDEDPRGGACREAGSFASADSKVVREDSDRSNHWLARLHYCEGRKPFAMRYWWVNQNQTYRHEVAGGYLWSPKRNANSARNPFYETMREVAPGDLVLSFVDTRLVAVGIAQSYCWESPKPSEFGNAGQNWEDVGWKVRVAFTQLLHQIRPKDHIELLRPLLPTKYSPLQVNGNGLQSIYLAEIPDVLAEVLFGLIGAEAQAIQAAGTGVLPVPADDLDSWEVKIERRIEEDATMGETDRLALVRARRGQGLFRDRVARIENRCRITGVDKPTHLVASHCKPWRDATNEERLNGENGLLLLRRSIIFLIVALSASRTMGGLSCLLLRTSPRCSAWGST